MKHLQLFFWIACICFLLACTSDKKHTIEEETATEVDKVIDSLARVDTLAIVSKPPEIPEESEEKVAIENKARKVSLFQDLGCCAEEGQGNNDCCCEAVVKQYAVLLKELLETDTKKLNDIKTTDPFFGDCMKIAKWIQVVDALENPEPAAEEELDTDDMW